MMKTDTRHYLGWSARARLLGRILGITAVFAALAGLALLGAIVHDLTFGHVRNALFESAGAAFVAALLIVVGTVVAAVVLLWEIVASFAGSGQRSLVGANSIVQVLLALLVFVLLNSFSFNFFNRYDMTREKTFTLPAPVASEMRELKGKTTIVVLQRHRTFGQLSEQIREQDDSAYDSAAERKVVDKVQDLVDQFRLLGPQFQVVTLNHGSKPYAKQVQEETERRPGLREAIAAAPENSIFFYPDDRVEEVTKEEALRRSTTGHAIHSQPIAGSEKVYAYEGNIPRLSFNEFYQLDKSASKAANPGPDGEPRGNLVLRPQGVEAFARRVLAIQEKRPKVGLLVIHEVLSSSPSSASRDEYTSAGIRRSLEEYGFEVVDVVVKKWGEAGGPSPAAYALAETQFDRLEATLEGLEDERRDLQEERAARDKTLAVLKTAKLEELQKMVPPQLRRDVDERWRDLQLRATADRLKQIDERAAELEQERRDVEAQVTTLLANDRAFADRRVTDVKAKLNRLVADCDLLIVPRMTVMNATAMESIRPSLYRLSKEQVEVLKDFMKTGKPVLVCAGPNAEPKDLETVRRERENPLPAEPLDDLERLLADRGVQLGRETIITNAEAKGFAARRAGEQLGGATTEVPPVTFAAPAGDKDNPIAAAMRATAASADQQLPIKLQDPRPVYVSEQLEKKLSFQPAFLMSPAASWNEEFPMVVRELPDGRQVVYPPRFRASSFDDPKRGSVEEVRRGPFPVGVAIESTMPVGWYDQEYGGVQQAAILAMPFDGQLGAAASAHYLFDYDKETKKIVPQTKRPVGRLVVIGQGSVFTGKQLTPGQEKLLLHTCNWLLKRDERLPRTDAEWKYPRVERDERESFLWKWGPFLGLPAVFLYLGLIVWIVRRVR